MTWADDQLITVDWSGHGSRDVKLAVLDLNKHEVAWESTHHPELLHFDVFRGHEAQYFLGDSTRVAAFDGTTGTMTAAIRLGHQDARAFHATRGQLWLFSMEYGRMDALSWVRLDSTSLELIAAGNEEYRPTVITDEFADWLGAP